MQLRTETKVGLFVLIAIVLFGYIASYFGVFRLYVKNYNHYYLYFDDLSGLEKKSDVKIAGVKVGWIDNIKLIDNGMQAKVSIALKRNFVLYCDARAQIRQEGLLGNKYLKIFPGNPKTGIITSGGNLTNKVESLISIEHLIKKIDNIATNMQEFTLKQQEHLKSIIGNVHQATSKISVFCDTLVKNEKNIDQLINNLQTVLKNLIQTLPSFQNNIQCMSSRFDSTMEHVQSVAKKVDDGDGLLGKLVNGFWRKKKKKNVEDK